MDGLHVCRHRSSPLSVSVRFIERCVLERRIRYVKLGRFVRIPEGGVADFIEAGDVPARW
ncbi:MAG: excisionase [Ilumatobacteraceae bacterium]